VVVIKVDFSSETFAWLDRRVKIAALIVECSCDLCAVASALGEGC